MFFSDINIRFDTEILKVPPLIWFDWKRFKLNFHGVRNLESHAFIAVHFHGCNLCTVSVLGLSYLWSVQQHVTSDRELTLETNNSSLVTIFHYPM